jgi:hypothetical protein
MSLRASAGRPGAPSPAPRYDRSMTRGAIRGTGGCYANGLEPLEIWVNHADASELPAEIGKRVPVDLVVQGRRFRAGLRAAPRTRYVWICPNVRDQHEVRTTLAEIFRELRWPKNKQVTLHVSGTEIVVRS